MSFVIRISALISKDDKILFVKEGKENFHYGKWNLPGGHLENREKLVSAVKREISEETNLDIDVTSILGIYTNMHNKHYLSFVFNANVIGGEIEKQQEEILDITWLTLKDVELMGETAFVYPNVLKKMLADFKNDKSMPLDYLSEFQ